MEAGNLDYLVKKQLDFHWEHGPVNLLTCKTSYEISFMVLISLLCVGTIIIIDASTHK